MDFRVSLQKKLNNVKRTLAFKIQKNRMKWRFPNVFVFSIIFKWACHNKTKQETLRVVTITMICPTLASLWKFQYFWRLIYNPVEHLRWSFYCENGKPLSIFRRKSSIVDARLGSKCASANTWILFKRLISLKYFIL